jgi:sporulation protein YlmC with PRC-barrel domain
MVIANIPLFLTARTIKGGKVINMAGEHLGKIEDIMIDLENGRVAYSVLSVGGFRCFGNKLFAVPCEALSVRPHKQALVFDVAKKILKETEDFDKDDWLRTREWLVNIYTCYGYKSYWQTGVLEQTVKERPGEIEAERIS